MHTSTCLSVLYHHYLCVSASDVWCAGLCQKIFPQTCRWRRRIWQFLPGISRRRVPGKVDPVGGEGHTRRLSSLVLYTGYNTGWVCTVMILRPKTKYVCFRFQLEKSRYGRSALSFDFTKIFYIDIAFFSTFSPIFQHIWPYFPQNSQ